MWSLCDSVCAQFDPRCVFMWAHSCMHAWEKKIGTIKTHSACLPSHNKCTHIFGTLWHNPPPSHTYAHISSHCDELSVPVRLGILVSRRFRSPFTGTELKTFSPQHFQRVSAASAGRKAENMKERGQTGSESQGALVILESLYLIICWNSFHPAWAPQFAESVPEVVSNPTSVSMWNNCVFI